MNSTDPFSQINGGNGGSVERSVLDYLLFMLAAVLIIVGAMMLFLTLRELYIIYQSPIDESTFIARVARFLTNMPFVVGASGNTIVILEGAAKILAFFLFFLFVSLVVSVGASLLKAGVSILPKATGKLPKISINQSVPNLEIGTASSTAPVKYENKD